MTRPSKAGLLVLLAGVAIGLFAQNAIPIGVFHDDGQYLILARSIAEHATYRFDNLPGTPPGLHYPPGYPAFLSIVWWLAPGNVQALKMANACLLGAAALAVFWFARRVFGLREWTAAAVGLCVVASAPFVWVNSLLISETLFTTMLYATFALDSDRGRAGRPWPVAVGVMAGATALVRSLADPLGVVLVGRRLMQRRWRDAALIGVAWFAIVAPWKIWVRMHAHDMPVPLAGAYGEYGAWWQVALHAHGPGFLWDTLLANLAQLSVTLSVFGWPSVLALRWLSLALVVALAAVGAVVSWRSAAVVCAFGLIYAAVVFVWPYEPDRFLWMLAPAVLGAVAVGATVTYYAARSLGGRYRWIAGAAALVVVTGVVQMHITTYRTRPWEVGLGERGDKGKAAARLAQGLPAGARIASDFDELVHLQTGLMLVPARGLTAEEYIYPVSDSLVAVRLDSAFVVFGITHVIVGDVPTLNAVQWLRAHGATLTPVASDSGRAVVFARSVPAQASGASSAPLTSPVRK